MKNNKVIKILKRRVKYLYIERRRMLNSRQPYDCGNELIEHVISEIGILRQKINKVLDALAILNPSCPKVRL